MGAAANLKVADVTIEVHFLSHNMRCVGSNGPAREYVKEWADIACGAQINSNFCVTKNMMHKRMNNVGLLYSLDSWFYSVYSVQHNIITSL